MKRSASHSNIFTKPIPWWLAVPILIIVFIIGLMVLIPPVAVFYCSFTDKCSADPPWGPFLSNKNADWQVLLVGSDYFLHYKWKSKTGNIFVKESSVDLLPYIGKHVALEGMYIPVDFAKQREQCIREKCHDVSDPPNTLEGELNLHEWARIDNIVEKNKRD